jgi:hypothetical protein
MGYKCYGFGDDLCIIVDTIEEIPFLIQQFPKFFEFQPLDTALQYFLGFTYIDVDHPHAMGMKFTKDEAGSYSPVSMVFGSELPNYMSWETDLRHLRGERKGKAVHFKMFNDQEIMAYRQIYTNVEPLLPYIDEFMEDLTYFSPRWLVSRMAQAAKRRELDEKGFELSMEPGPERDTRSIHSKFNRFRNMMLKINIDIDKELGLK